MKSKMKKWIGVVVLVWMTALFPVAASAYSGSAAVEFARSHCASNHTEYQSNCPNGWICAEFVANCLKNGGFNITPSNLKKVRDLYNALTKLGTSYGLEISTSGLKNGDRYIKNTGANAGKIAVGDVIITHCKRHDVYLHAILVSNIDANGYVYSYAHNGNSFNRITTASRNCKIINYAKEDYSNIQAYVIHFNSTVQPSDDSYYYAKVEGTDGSLSINDRALSTNAGAKQLGVIPENGACKVYNSGAVGNWKRVNFKGITGYAWGPCLKTGLNPVGNVERVTVENGMIRLVGWAFDYDAVESRTSIWTYIGDPRGTGTAIGCNSTNMSGEDVEKVYPGVGLNHRFDLRFSTAFKGNQQVYVCVSNINGGSDTVFGPYSVYIPCTHTWDSGRVVTAATCTTSGSKRYNCTRCGNTKTETIPATGHQCVILRNASDASCVHDGYTGDRYCFDCKTTLSKGSLIPQLEHSWDQGTVTRQPTEMTEGIKTYTCTICRTTKTENIARLEVKEPEKQLTSDYSQNFEKTKETEKQDYTGEPWKKPSDFVPAENYQTSVTLLSSTLPLQVKQSVSLTKLITAMTTGDRLVSCTTSNKKIAAVNNAGKVTGKKAGKAKIAMNFASGLSKTVTVKVQKAKVATSKITNIPGSITLKVKKTYKLSPVIAPITTKNKATYKTANKKIATVAKNGKITAKKVGRTTITVKVGKKTKKVKVTVIK